MSDKIKREFILRPATVQDIPILESWDTEPHVISATTDSKDAAIAFGDHDWTHEIVNMQSPFYQYFIAERESRPIGGMLIIDPLNEKTHYWGKIEPNLRAVDIWIGAKTDLGKGYGEQMMRLAFQLCFSPPEVTAIVIDPLLSNTRSHVFYQRLGFVPVGQQFFGEDDCLVHRLTRQDWVRKFPQDSIKLNSEK